MNHSTCRCAFTVIVLLSISPFRSVNICFMYLSAPMLGAYVFKIVIRPSWVHPLIIIQCPSLFLVTVFILKSILSDISVVTLAFF